MFRGNHSAKIDQRGRIRLPSAFLVPLREKFGDELFLTSLSGSFLRLYPMPVWLKIEEKLLSIPSMTPSRAKLLDRLTYFGQESRLDKVGRIVVPQRLRESAGLNGEVVVLGYLDYLEIWDPKSFAEKLDREALTDDDNRLLSELGL